MDNFLINVAVNDHNEWFANFTDGSIPLCATNYQDAILEADHILSEDDYAQWEHEVNSEMDFY